MSSSQPTSVTRVAVAVVESAGAYLVGVRGSDGPLPGYHEFPGGKLNHGESVAEGARRECREETGLDVVPGELLSACIHDYPHGRVEIAFVLCTPVKPGRPAALGRFEWRAAEELAALKFPEANAPVVKLLLARN